MVLHELSTNAAKYGALSSEGGKVQVSWAQEQEGSRTILSLRWIETGGPRAEPPTRRGFGQQLIERNITRDLGGTADLQFVPSGLRCALRFPL
jgi:two-component sensor histidine kinase